MRIASLPSLPHSFGFGGFEVQALDAIASLRASGIEVIQLDPWKKEEYFDILHLWGLEIGHLPVIDWAKRVGKPVVLTALLPYWGLKWWARYRSPGTLMALKTNVAISATHLVVVNSLQRKAAERYFPGVPVTVIPNIVADEFFGTSAPESTSAGVVLCVGNICSRKNQVGLAQASELTGIRVHFIGSVVKGEERYADLLTRLIDRNRLLSWDTDVQPRSPRLLAAYRDCSAFALASYSETQPISALEALAAGKAILLGDRPYAQDPLFSSAVRVEPSKVNSIAAGLGKIARRGKERISVDLSSCRSKTVANLYAGVYEQAYSANGTELAKR